MVGFQPKWHGLSNGPAPAAPSFISAPRRTSCLIGLRPGMKSVYSDEDQLPSESKLGSKISGSNGQGLQSSQVAEWGRDA